jgi:hypothetical protein
VAEVRGTRKSRATGGFEVWRTINSNPGDLQRIYRSREKRGKKIGARSAISAPPSSRRINTAEGDKVDIGIK